jgi:hypothetical protein
MSSRTPTGTGIRIEQAFPLPRRLRREKGMSFPLYLIGFLIFIGGVAWALIAANVPILYVVIGCTILLGIGIMTGVSKTRTKDPPSK